MFEADFGTKGNRWELVRVRPGCESELVLLSQEFFALTVHWVGHSVPCAGNGCVLCESLVARGLFYLGGVCQNRLAMIELGSESAMNLEQHLKLLNGGFVPGLRIRFLRRSAKAPVHGEVVGKVEVKGPITRRQLARRVLALYKFPCDNPDESEADYETRIARMARARNEQIAKRLASSSDGRLRSRV